MYVFRCQQVSPVDNIFAAGLTFLLGHVDVEGAKEVWMNQCSHRIQWKCPTLSSITDNHFVVR